MPGSHHITFDGLLTGTSEVNIFSGSFYGVAKQWVPLSPVSEYYKPASGFSPCLACPFPPQKSEFGGRVEYVQLQGTRGPWYLSKSLEYPYLHPVAFFWEPQLLSKCVAH